jgi:hypothetical protein
MGDEAYGPQAIIGGLSLSVLLNIFSLRRISLGLARAAVHSRSDGTRSLFLETLAK